MSLCGPVYFNSLLNSSSFSSQLKAWVLPYLPWWALNSVVFGLLGPNLLKALLCFSAFRSLFLSRQIFPGVKVVPNAYFILLCFFLFPDLHPLIPNRLLNSAVSFNRFKIYFDQVLWWFSMRYHFTSPTQFLEEVTHFISFKSPHTHTLIKKLKSITSQK